MDMRNTLRRKMTKLDSSREGAFGCTETQVTVNVVARQLQRISQIDRSEPESEMGMLVLLVVVIGETVDPDRP